MTRKLLNKLPNNVRQSVEMLKKNYKNEVLDHEKVMSRASGYCTGLRDGGLITDRERQILFIYITL